MRPIPTILLVVSMSVGLGLRATALAQAPASLPVQGFLTDVDGTPLSGPQTMTFSIYSGEFGGTALFEETQPVNVESGYFTAYIGAVNPLDLTLFRDNQVLFVETRIDAEVLMPRQRLASAPYAAYAEHAGTAQGVSGPVGFAQLSGVPSGLDDGDDDTTYSAGPGISISSANAIGVQLSAGTGIAVRGAQVSARTDVLQRRLNGSCTATQAIRSVDQDGNVTCGDFPSLPQPGSTLVDRSGTWDVRSGLYQLATNRLCPAGQALRQITPAGNTSCEVFGDLQGVTTPTDRGLDGGCSVGTCTLSVDPTDFNGADPIGTSARTSLVFTPAGSTAFSTIIAVSVDVGRFGGEVMLIASAQAQCVSGCTNNGNLNTCEMGWTSSSVGTPTTVARALVGRVSQSLLSNSLTAIDEEAIPPGTGGTRPRTYYLRGRSLSTTRQCGFGYASGGAIFIPD